MANYHYDEAGNMAAYFMLTFLFIVLTPLTLSATSSSKQRNASGCSCQQCVAHRETIRKREAGSLLKPKLRKKTIILSAGWALFGYLVYKVMTTEVETKIYNPFEILGISSSTSIKEIKSHYKKLSRKFHPDKVKLTINETMEAVEAKFVEITKAYKSLTDETIRNNWEQYGHPDGRQEISMGIALPQWIVEGKNNIWVLGVYGIVFGGALPAMVGRWWFGNRQKTKDGVNARTAATFFKTLTEESGFDEVIGSLARTFEWERPTHKTVQEAELEHLETQIKDKLDGKWNELTKLAEVIPGTYETRRRAFILLYAHLLRLPVTSTSLQNEQTELLLQTPVLLNAMLNISISRNWLLPTLAAMRLHAYLAQAIPPGQEHLKLAQLPFIKEDEAKELLSTADAPEDVVALLAGQGDGRVEDVKKAVEKWGKLDIADVSFKVIGERVVVPASIVYLVVKLRLTLPGSAVDPNERFVDEVKRKVRAEEEKDEEFLMSRKDAEDQPTTVQGSGWAHAPYWPANRKPGWWIVLSDVKMGKVVVPPLKITDIPLSDPSRDRNYRAYKIQFQAPQGVGLYIWKLFIISDTFIGEEYSQEIALKIDDMSVLDANDQTAEDEISDPDEDSLAGQMAMMRGGKVKKRGEDESDDESSTDDDRKSEPDSSSDSD